jgi:hypothetical protein
VTDRLRFTINLDDIRDARRLQQRNVALVFGSAFVVVGSLIWLVSGSWSALALALIGIFVLAEWRFPIFDRWFDRRRLVLGSECEMWLDESGLNFRQTGTARTFEMSGQVDWSRISGLREDSRALLVMDGRVVRAGIPKRAFTSSDALAEFRDEIARRVAERQRGSRSSGP